MTVSSCFQSLRLSLRLFTITCLCSVIGVSRAKLLYIIIMVTTPFCLKEIWLSLNGGYNHFEKFYRRFYDLFYGDRPGQKLKEQACDLLSTDDNTAIFSLCFFLFAVPVAITSVIVVSSSGTSSLKLSLLGLVALAPVMAITAVILIATSLAEAYLDTRVTSVFSRITAIVLAALSIQYIIDGLQTLYELPIS